MIVTFLVGFKQKTPMGERGQESKYRNNWEATAIIQVGDRVTKSRMVGYRWKSGWIRYVSWRQNCSWLLGGEAQDCLKGDAQFSSLSN